MNKCLRFCGIEKGLQFFFLRDDLSPQNGSNWELPSHKKQHVNITTNVSQLFYFFNLILLKKLLSNAEAICNWHDIRKTIFMKKLLAQRTRSLFEKSLRKIHAKLLWRKFKKYLINNSWYLRSMEIVKNCY